MSVIDQTERKREAKLSERAAVQPGTGRNGIWSRAEPTWAPNRTGGARVDKVERFGWKIVDEAGELHWLDKASLSVDHEIYQRSVDNPNKVDRIAAEWSWMACGALIVALRQNGSYWVVDGQNRLVAALKRSDITKLPCLLFAVGTPEEEAAAFVRINRNRRTLSRTDLFRAELGAGDEQSSKLRDLLGAAGYAINNSGTRRTAACVDALLRAMRSDRAALQAVVSIYDQEFDGARMLHEVVDGLMFLSAAGVDLNNQKLRRRLRDIGIDDVLSSIRRCCQFRGKQTREANAEGIAIVVNKGLRTKLIEWPHSIAPVPQ